LERTVRHISVGSLGIRQLNEPGLNLKMVFKSVSANRWSSTDTSHITLTMESMVYSIHFYFLDRSKETVKSNPIPLCQRGIYFRDMIVKSTTGKYFVGERLNRLVQRLVEKRFLKEKYDPMPFIAVMDVE